MNRARRGPRPLPLALVLCACGASQGLAATPVSTQVTTTVVVPDTFSTFQIRQVPRSTFLLAHPLAVRSDRESGAPRRRSPARGGGIGGISGGGLADWDRIAADISQVRDLPKFGSSTVEARYGLSGMRLTPAGRLQVEAKVGSRPRHRYLSWGVLRLDAFNGTSATLGDAAALDGAPGLEGFTMRGIKLEHTLQWMGPGGAPIRAGLLLGRSPVGFANMEANRYPRSVESAYAEQARPGGPEIRAQLFDLADRRSGDVSSLDQIRSGSGIGVSAASRRTSSDIAASLYKSVFHFGDGTYEGGSDLLLRGRRRLGFASFGGAWQATHGSAYVAGPFGALQPLPTSTLDVDASVRSGDRAASVWTGQWRQTSGRIKLAGATDGSIASPPPPPSLASRSSQWGARVDWKLPGIGTGVSFSREQRRREISTGDQDVTTYSAAASQSVSSRTSLSIRWNDMRYRQQAPSRYVSGNLSVRLGRCALLAVQQQTEWQEPIGPRIVTMADLSSVRLFDDRATLSARLSQTYDQVGSGFQPSQTLAQMTGFLTVAGGIVLSTRYQLIRSSSGSEHTLEIGFSRAPGRGSGPPERSLLEASQLVRQLLHGVVFEDRNGDGVRQEDEPGIPGIQIVVNGDIWEPIATDLQGNFRALVPPGRHVLRALPESIPLAFSLEGLGPVEADVRVDRVAEVAIPLVRQVGTIRGRVVRGHSASDSTGIETAPISPSEPGLSGVRVLLNGLEITYTDAQGNYRFPGLPAGDYEVTLDPKSLPFGYRAEGEAVRRIAVGASAGGTVSCDFRVSRPVQRSQF